jgi:hypothetical protein
MLSRSSNSLFIKCSGGIGGCEKDRRLMNNYLHLVASLKDSHFVAGYHLCWYSTIGLPEDVIVRLSSVHIHVQHSNTVTDDCQVCGQSLFPSRTYP